MRNIKEIQQEWEQFDLHKTAGGWRDALKALTSAGKGALKLGKELVFDRALWAIPTAAVFAALIKNKITTPEVVAKNADKRLVLNALDTEIAVIKKQLDNMGRNTTDNDSTQPYDRFI